MSETDRQLIKRAILISKRPGRDHWGSIERTLVRAVTLLADENARLGGGCIDCRTTTAPAKSGAPTHGETDPPGETDREAMLAEVDGPGIALVRAVAAGKYAEALKEIVRLRALATHRGPTLDQVCRVLTIWELSSKGTRSPVEYLREHFQAPAPTEDETAPQEPSAINEAIYEELLAKEVDAHKAHTGEAPSPERVEYYAKLVRRDLATRELHDGPTLDEVCAAMMKAGYPPGVETWLRESFQAPPEVRETGELAAEGAAPTWVEDDGYHQTTHAGYACWVHGADRSWRWAVGQGTPTPGLLSDGRARSLAGAKKHCLRAAEGRRASAEVTETDQPATSGLGIREQIEVLKTVGGDFSVASAVHVRATETDARVPTKVWRAGPPLGRVVCFYAEGPYAIYESVDHAKDDHPGTEWSEKPLTASPTRLPKPSRSEDLPGADGVSIDDAPGAKDNP